MSKGKGGKAPNGSGSVWQRPDGRYSAALTVPYHDPDTGKTKRRRMTTTKKLWEDAHAWLMRQQSDLLGNVVRATNDDVLVREFLADWLRDAVEPLVALNTYKKREYAVRVHLSPALGHFCLDELQPRAVQALYSKLMRSGLSLATRREIHVTLKMALAQAVRWGMSPRNVADMVDAPKQGRVEASEADDEEDEVRALTDEQACELFRTTRESRWRNYYVAAIRTGLRPGEMLGLRWGDLSLGADPDSLRVRRTLDTKGRGPARFNPPKSAASRRRVVLHWEASGAFEAQREMLVHEDLPVGSKDLVFPSTTGSAMSADNLRWRYLKSDLRKAKLPELSPHELRHTFASIMLYEWRMPVEVVAEMMGHESPAMTLRLYAHFVPGSQEAAIRALRNMHTKPDSSTSATS